jgi:thiol-disulfide isomerase/thioredoxin
MEKQDGKVVYKNPVIQQNARDLASLLESSTDDIIIEMYAVWCKKCDSLKPFYENLAYDLKIAEASVKVVVVDGVQAKNDIQDGIQSDDLSMMLTWTKIQVPSFALNSIAEILGFD